ncbi:MAG: NAD(P)-binding domain-containing protein [Trueperaceae bacterium]|nr:NAD(P)-binding domain-containing protein [Trueperaceae bacterium]
MNRFALIGVSHRRGGAAALESWQAELNSSAIKSRGFDHFVHIATCNRWDTFTVLPEDLSLDEARDLLSLTNHKVKPYAYHGDAALEQLTRIASSLDSLNPGEDQIMKQVREAYQHARQAGTVDKAVSFAFETALKIAKKVRREIDLAPMNTSLFSLARTDIERLIPKSGKVAVLGAGSMGTLAAKSLVFLGYETLIVNRSEERARHLAKHLNQPHRNLAQFFEDWPELDLIVCATPIKHLLDKARLEHLRGLKLIVDLGIPRNVDAEAAEALGIKVLDVDRLQLAGQTRREELGQKLAEAEKLIFSELELALDDWSEKQIGPGITRLRDWYLTTIGDSLDSTIANHLAHKFAHVPIKGLRAIARAYGPEAAQLFLKESGLDD